MPEYELRLRFTAADGNQASRLAAAWADTCAAEYGTHYAGLQLVSSRLPDSTDGPTCCTDARQADPWKTWTWHDHHRDAVCAWCGRAIALAPDPRQDGPEWFCSDECDDACTDQTPSDEEDGCSDACQGTWPAEPGQPQRPFHVSRCPNRSPSQSGT